MPRLLKFEDAYLFQTPSIRLMPDARRLKFEDAYFFQSPPIPLMPDAGTMIFA
jgi:hypothetical protein